MDHDSHSPNGVRVDEHSSPTPPATSAAAMLPGVEAAQQAYEAAARELAAAEKALADRETAVSALADQHKASVAAWTKARTDHTARMTKLAAEKAKAAAAKDAASNQLKDDRAELELAISAARRVRNKAHAILRMERGDLDPRFRGGDS